MEEVLFDESGTGTETVPPAWKPEGRNIGQAVSGRTGKVFNSPARINSAGYDSSGG